VKGWWPFYVKKENEEMELTVGTLSYTSVHCGKEIVVTSF
jgi:hypothetical protein